MTLSTARAERGNGIREGMRTIQKGKTMEISDKARKMTKENNLEEEVNQAYIDLVGEEYAEADEASEAYQGHYNSDEDFVMQLLDDIGTIPKDLPGFVHIDWEWTAQEVMMDYAEKNGYYFRNL